MHRLEPGYGLQLGIEISQVLPTGQPEPEGHSGSAGPGALVGAQLLSWEAAAGFFPANQLSVLLTGLIWPCTEHVRGV